MNEDDIILMADASGIAYYGMGKDREKFIYYLKAFASFVAAAEREACAKLCEAQGEYGWQQYADAIRARSQREALAQPEPTPWRDMVVVSLVREGILKHKARELADHFAAQRPWQGLTDEDKQTAVWTDGTFGGGALWAQQLLKERNE
jgi:hypothetical protein